MMIRVCRNLAALCLLLAIAGVPAKAVGMQDPEAACEFKDYYNDGEEVEFGGCANSCDWLEDHCSWYCGAEPTGFDCWGDHESGTSGYCWCSLPMESATP